MKHLIKPILFILIVFAIGSCKKTVTITKEAAHWEYENPDWKSIGYNDCGGNSQSPININPANAISTDELSGITFNYTPFFLKIVDNGHTIQVNASNNNTIVYNGAEYKFLQLHFHHKSEHKINDEQASMELHLVHQDGQGNLLVLAYMIEEGEESDLLEKVLSHVPDEHKVEESFNDVMIDLMDFQPASQSYYTYFGSLTTPPCSASVQFVVFKSKIHATEEQIEEFASHYEDNARPVQPLNNRIILEKL